MAEERESAVTRQWHPDSMLYPRRRPLGTVHEDRTMRIQRPEKLGEAWSPAQELPRLLALLYDLSEAGDTNAAVDLTFTALHDILEAGDWKRCEEVLSNVEPAKLSTRVLLAFLMSTFAARSRLKQRDGFYTRVTKRLQGELPEDKVEALLQGLK